MKFYGAVGFGKNTESASAPGVWEDVMSQYNYFGDVTNNTLRFQEAAQVSDDLSVDNSISIVADAYARENFSAIKYVYWNGEFWDVTSVQIQHPRLLLHLGGVYSGPLPPGVTRDP